MHSKSNYTRSYLWHSAAAESRGDFGGGGARESGGSKHNLSEAGKFGIELPLLMGSCDCTDKRKEGGYRTTK